MFYLAASHTPRSGFDHQDRAVSDAGVDSQSAAGDSGAEGSDSEFVLLFTVDDLSSFETESHFFLERSMLPFGLLTLDREHCLL